MSMNIITDAARNIAHRLTWHTAGRDQAGIASDLADGKDIPEVYGLGEAGLFDEFFYFLESFGFHDLLEGLNPKSKKRESPVPFMAIIYIYLMRVVAGLKFFYHIDPVILHSQSLMRLVGFNGREVREGTCGRGQKKKASVEQSETKESDKNESGSKTRGPVCPAFIASCIASIAATALEKTFNATISLLAAGNFFPKSINASLDASEIQSTEKCSGCGKVTKEKAPELRLRKNRIRKVMETVFGFKIWVVWDPNSKIPLALRFRTIEVADVNLAQEVIEQAITNLGDHARLNSIAMDRGFMDGALLWWLTSKKIIFYIPAKSNMNVYSDALSLVESGFVQTRSHKRSVGAGKNRTTVTDYWEVVGIEGLTSAGFYGSKGSGPHEHRKDFSPNPINAVVVVDDPFKRNNPTCNTMVILTNALADKPLRVYKGYDARSEIENSMFREAKQAWFIQRAPINTQAGFLTHVYLTVLVMALTTAFQTWMDQQDTKEKGGEETGIRKFREKVREENGNQLIIFDGDKYAIFYAYEVLILCGRNVTRPNGVTERITKEDILCKYGASIE